MTTLDMLRAFFVERLGVDPRRVTLEARLREDLDLDSLDLVELSVHAEQHLGRAVPEESLPRLTTVADLAALVEAAPHSPTLKGEPP